MKKGKLLIIIVALALLLLPNFFAGRAGEAEALGEILPLWSCIPFLGMLLSIALFPLFRPHWWEKNLFNVAILWSLVFLIPFAAALGPGLAGFEFYEIVLLDYLPFIVLLWGLFAVAGGIVLKGSLSGSPKVNLILLLVGTLLASWVGTTGASMLMIRPVLRANAWREKKAHVIVFFIFLVSNIGGCLTPIGDPPLFLGFLRNVPFFWTMRLAPMLLLNAAILLVVFFILDKKLYKKEIAAGRKPAVEGPKEPLRVEGLHNLVFLAMIVGAVILSGILGTLDSLKDPATGEIIGIPFAYGISIPINNVIQMAIIVVAGLLSVRTTKKELHEQNHFTWGPIKEVACLFIGIFITMIPALAILHARGADLGLSEPWQFFWVTGALSSFLDNAPTYLVFMTTASSLPTAEGLTTLIGTIAPQILLAVSAGAVFMGANTYIGNAPNFMVRSIAEENEVKMPSFFGYMGWAVRFLIPVFIIDTIVFFVLLQ
ncbi:MAG: sodium:proton antiporter [Clostridiales Family XIII bacterium]|jgi:Na+/H+ antiporter NhaD/arsenite permease-like protein|nr:sodium:proton antiporter [Clostridiales Family XIII bacterium]